MRVVCKVTVRGGYVHVVMSKDWCNVAAPFRFPASFTSRSFALREYYAKLLFDFEQVYFHQITGPRSTPPGWHLAQTERLLIHV